MKLKKTEILSYGKSRMLDWCSWWKNSNFMKGKHRTNNRIIRLVDKTDLSVFVILFFAGLFLCSFAYYFLSFFGHGLESTFNKEKVDYLSSLYFSIVTISSLGYGDYRPIGTGRIISVIEVIYGLVMISLVVAKIASERQSVLVKLIYSSDNERRIKEFKESLFHLSETAVFYQKDPFDENKIRKLVKEIKCLIHSLKSYLIFHIKQGILLEVGAQKNIQGILKLFYRLQCNCLLLSKYSQKSVRTDLESISVKLIYIASFYVQEEEEVKSKQILEKMKIEHRNYRKFVKDNLKHPNDRAIKNTLVMTPSLSDLVEKILPKQPWKKHIHKEVAFNLAISNKLAHKTISFLVEAKRV